jgi:endonuclease/exonuclease/phosphatase (EEP) superfamily protein YafD
VNESPGAAALHDGLATNDGSSSPAAYIRWIVRAIRIGGWIAAALALIGFAGAIARTFDLASHFRVAYALAMALALATYARDFMRRRWQCAALSFALALDAAAIAVLYLPSESLPGAGPEGASIRLLQFNTWPKNRSDREVLSLVEAEQPDVASLQETSASLRAAVALGLADRYEMIEAGSELLLIRRDAPSIELRKRARHALPGGEAIAASLSIAGREIEVLSFHAMAPLGPARAAIRDAQFEWVARWARSRPGPVIVLGDLNATPWSYAFDRLLRDADLLDSTRGFGVQPTWRTRYGPVSGVLAWPLQIPIDHCLHSAGLATIAREIGPACGSNHFPLIVVLRSGAGAVP